MPPLLLLLITTVAIAAAVAAGMSWLDKSRWSRIAVSAALILYAGAWALVDSMAEGGAFHDEGVVYAGIAGVAGVGVLGVISGVLEIRGRRTVTPFVLSLVVVVGAAAGGVAVAVATGSSPELGLDLQGGISVVYEPTEDATDDQLDQGVQIIRERVDALGVAEPEITRQGDAIVVQIPGVDDPDRVLELIGTTAELQFRPVQTLAPVDTFLGIDAEGEGEGGDQGQGSEQGNGEGAEGQGNGQGDGGNQEGDGGSQGDGEGSGGEPSVTPPSEDDPEATVTLPDERAEEFITEREEDPEAELDVDEEAGEPKPQVYTLGPSLATGRIVEGAEATLPPGTGTWEVLLTMRAGQDGIDQFNQVAAVCYSGGTECPTGMLAITLDSVVRSAPTIQQPSYERDQISISGDFTEDEAKDLALVLRYGSLPVELEAQAVEEVSATLGQDSLRAGIVAGIIGLALVVLYMLLYYRVLGAVVVAGLSIWSGLMYAVISWFGASQGLALTLAGITGIIVSVGITVDSYVVYFERLKDDARMGRTLRSSAERTFKRAFKTILAADATTFIGAAILWYLTVGAVRGFAFYLGLSTILDVVVGWAFTRPTVALLSRTRLLNKAQAVGVAERAESQVASLAATGAQGR